MFPYVCLATMPLFCEENWPRKLVRFFWRSEDNITPSKACIYPEDVNKNRKTEDHLPTKITWKHRLVVVLLLSHCGLQAFLPYSHFITKVGNSQHNQLSSHHQLIRSCCKLPYIFLSYFSVGLSMIPLFALNIMMTSTLWQL